MAGVHKGKMSSGGNIYCCPVDTNAQGLQVANSYNCSVHQSPMSIHCSPSSNTNSYPVQSCALSLFFSYLFKYQQFYLGRLLCFLSEVGNSSCLIPKALYYFILLTHQSNTLNQEYKHTFKFCNMYTYEQVTCIKNYIHDTGRQRKRETGLRLEVSSQEKFSNLLSLRSSNISKAGDNLREQASCSGEQDKESYIGLKEARFPNSGKL